MDHNNIVYFNNCKNRPHSKLFGNGAYFDLDITGHQSTLVPHLPVGQDCVVASQSKDDQITFDWYELTHEKTMPEKRTPGVKYRVFFGDRVSSTTLTRLVAAGLKHYEPFFDKLGRFKQQSVIVPKAIIASQSFKHVNVFPLIYRLITDRTDKSSAYIGHSDLVSALLQNHEGLAMVEVAMAQNLLGKRGTASNMVAWFSQRYTTHQSPYQELLERQQIGGAWAYRSRQSSRTASDVPATSLTDPDFSAMEGEPKLAAHLQRERSPELVKKKRHAVLKSTGRLACECCGFDAKKQFRGIEAPIVEVHHRAMLGAQEGAKNITLDDLAILCPTCHRAVHRAKDLTVEQFAAKYFPVQ